MADVIYINHWRALRARRPQPEGMVTYDLDFMCMTLEEYYGEDRELGTVEESLLEQLDG